MSPDEQERFYEDLAEALFTPVRELATRYETIIKDGPITNDDIQ
jgi:hypothetical protein